MEYQVGNKITLTGEIQTVNGSGPGSVLIRFDKDHSLTFPRYVLEKAEATPTAVQERGRFVREVYLMSPIEGATVYFYEEAGCKKYLLYESPTAVRERGRFYSCIINGKLLTEIFRNFEDAEKHVESYVTKSSDQVSVQQVYVSVALTESPTSDTQKEGE